MFDMNYVGGGYRAVELCGTLVGWLTRYSINDIGADEVLLLQFGWGVMFNHQYGM